MADRNISFEGCALAMRRRRKVTLLHKANVFKLSDDLFLEAARDVLADYPQIETEGENGDIQSS